MARGGWTRITNDAGKDEQGSSPGGKSGGGSPGANHGDFAAETKIVYVGPGKGEFSPQHGHGSSVLGSVCNPERLFLFIIVTVLLLVFIGTAALMVPPLMNLVNQLTGGVGNETDVNATVESEAMANYLAGAGATQFPDSALVGGMPVQAGAQQSPAAQGAGAFGPPQQIPPSTQAGLGTPPQAGQFGDNRVPPPPPVPPPEEVPGGQQLPPRPQVGAQPQQRPSGPVGAQAGFPAAAAVAPFPQFASSTAAATPALTTSGAFAAPYPWPVSSTAAATPAPTTSQAFDCSGGSAPWTEAERMYCCQKYGGCIVRKLSSAPSS